MTDLGIVRQAAHVGFRCSRRAPASAIFLSRQMYERLSMGCALRSRLLCPQPVVVVEVEASPNIDRCGLHFRLFLQIQPVDTVKVRLQLVGEGTRSTTRTNPIKVALQIVKDEGPLGLYAGITAAWMRQVVYGSTRLGTHRVFSNMMKSHPDEQLPLYKKMAAGLASGCIGSFVGTPADLALVRMQSDATLPAESAWQSRLCSCPVFPQ